MAIIDFTDSIYDAQQGSQSAIKFIYDNTIQLFSKEANAFMRNKNEADRAIRDAYVFIFDHLDSLEDTSKFLLWANEVCKNTCISRLSEAGVFNERVPAEAINLGEISPAADYDPQINMSANMSPDYIQECLEAVLGSLPDNQRACAVLWGEGYPINSISRKLGISPVAVNYTLAYTLGNITNSVNTLSANGLPLFAMEPIPYFLWLLMSYYQFYQPKDAEPGAASSFSNVLRTLMPEEASVYSGEYVAEEPEYQDSRVMHVTSVEEGSAAKTPASDHDFTGDELDLADFIKGDSSGEKEQEDKAPEEDTPVVPPMDVIKPHETDAAEEQESEDAAEDAGAEEAEEEKKEETKEDSEGSEQVKDEKADIDEILGTIKDGGSGDDGKKKKHTGLIITLIVILVILCLLAAALLFFRDKVNSLLGTNFFSTTQTVTEPETTTPEPTTPEPETTTPEPTTEPPTTTEAPTEPETPADPGPEFDVRIYADGDALSMKDVPNGTGLLYIPSDEKVHISEVDGGWGHTSYDGEDGWIWLEYTKVDGNARVQEPETLLETPETFTIGYTEFNNELKTGPGNYFSTFGPIPEGTELTVEAYYTDDYNGAVWAYTSYDGHHGWVFLYYIEDIEE